MDALMGIALFGAGMTAGGGLIVSYARDKSGALVERYPDGDDHSIDAVAYGNREHIYRSRRTSNVSGKGARR